MNIWEIIHNKWELALDGMTIVIYMDQFTAMVLYSVRLQWYLEAVNLINVFLPCDSPPPPQSRI